MKEADDRTETRRDERVAQQRRELPDSPGVYLFHDGGGEILYVGKARSIRKRVASHFSGGETRLTSRVDRIECLVTSTEAEALLAEQSFIKRHRPRFNIRLRDDKSYPYVCVSLDEDYPRVYFTREKHRPGRAYFGPFSSAKRVRETLDLLGKLFQFRTCEGAEPGRRSGSPCLDYYIKRCGAPCVGYVSQGEYRRNVDAIVDFLSGRYRQVEADEQAKMDAAAVEREFERAALHRDRLKAIQSLFERQRVAGGSVGTADLIGVAAEGADANAQVFQVRDGILAERQSFYLDNQAERELAEVTEEFIGQYYSASPAVPRTIVVGPYLRDRVELLEAALSERRGGAVEVRVAERGDKRRLRELAERNARLALDQDRLRREHRRQRRVESLANLREALGMQELPVRIEGFDISNLGGEHTVASMVVFEGGATKKADYRRFRVRGEGEGDGDRSGPDDFASMEEVLAQADEPLSRAGGHLAARRQARRQLRLAALAGRDRRWQGPALGRDAGAASVRRARRHRDRARQAPRGGLRARPRGADRPAGLLGGLEAAAAGPRRGPPLRDRPPSRPPRPGDDRLGAR